MTTEMKQLLAFLLLGCCVLAVHGVLGGARKDPCSSGMAALEMFIEYEGCPEPSPFQILMEITSSFGEDFTVDHLDYLFTNYCSTAFPRIMSCFEGNIQRCSDAQQDSIMAVARQTGFVCEPNSERVNPVMKHMVRQLTDEDLAENDDCNKPDLFDIQYFCFERAMEAIGVTHANFSEYLESLELEELATKIQTFFRAGIYCMVTQTHDKLDSCPQWRRKALEVVGMIIFPTVLGNNMTFTTAEVDKMFDWKSPVPTHPTYPTQGPQGTQGTQRPQGTAGPGYLSIILQ